MIQFPIALKLVSCCDVENHINIKSLILCEKVDRTLRLGGRYVCISLLQPHILEFVVDSFARDRGWPVRIVRCKEAEEGRPPEDRTFPVFAVVATKFKRMENAIPVRNK